MFMLRKDSMDSFNSASGTLNAIKVQLSPFAAKAAFCIAGDSE
jgi:hypothetical protein